MCATEIRNRKSWPWPAARDYAPPSSKPWNPPLKRSSRVLIGKRKPISTRNGNAEKIAFYLWRREKADTSPHSNGGSVQLRFIFNTTKQPLTPHSHASILERY